MIARACAVFVALEIENTSITRSRSSTINRFLAHDLPRYKGAPTGAGCTLFRETLIGETPPLAALQ